MNLILQINRRIYEKNLVEILGPMVEKCDILGCFYMERPVFGIQRVPLENISTKNKRMKVLLK
jgi:hypothetical protein